MSRARTGAHRPNQHERAQRRAAVEHLLARALRGALTVPEAAVMADYWRREQRAADATRKSLHDTTQALERHRAAADTAIRELEQRAEQAEQQLAAYLANEEQRRGEAVDPVTLWPARAVEAVRTARSAAEEAEQRAAAQREMHEERRRALADAIGAPADTPWPKLVTDARTDADLARRATEIHRSATETAAELTRSENARDALRSRLDAAEQRHRAAEQALDRVRQADTLGAALAAVAEHDGMTPQAAAVHAAFTNAADSARARLEEQQRAHEVELAHSERRAASWASTAHRYAASLDAARAEADRFQAAWHSARLRAQVATRRAEHRLGVLERRRAQLRALEDQAREAVEEAAQQRARANGWRGHAIETDDRADRHLAAWRSARRRAAARTEERDRALALAAARGDALAAHLATTEATR